MGPIGQVCQLCPYRMSGGEWMRHVLEGTVKAHDAMPWWFCVSRSSVLSLWPEFEVVGKILCLLNFIPKFEGRFTPTLSRGNMHEKQAFVRY